ncbi:uncharacterized protein METZ01_LOCUS467086 [marine metagenome]|jgi:hypothetical protein|uniref:Uncharacterized protein n=1 Tax=marine metagenome TaxID=408172 RepID=A0A383B2N4_9ZZZZ|tara:strand:+ start:1248 stop:1379 length:132 start_codon:yes stop_codon:yes gene_type:complete
MMSVAEISYKIGKYSKNLKDANERLDESTEPLAILLIKKAFEE